MKYNERHESLIGLNYIYKPNLHSIHQISMNVCSLEWEFYALEFWF